MPNIYFLLRKTEGSVYEQLQLMLTYPMQALYLASNKVQLMMELDWAKKIGFGLNRALGFGLGSGLGYAKLSLSLSG